MLDVAGNREPKTTGALAAGVGEFTERYLGEVLRLTGDPLHAGGASVGAE